MDSVEQLKERYARMHDGELEAVAEEAYDLTDIARSLLQDEIAKRGLNVPLKMERSQRVAQPAKATGASKQFDPSKLDLFVAGTYWEIEDACKIKAFLHDAGIPCYWGLHYSEDPDEIAASFEKGVDLVVREEDHQRVILSLRELFSDQPRSEHEEAEFSFVCPKCKSAEIVLQDLDAAAKFNWHCDACGHEWNDDGVEQ